MTILNSYRHTVDGVHLAHYSPDTLRDLLALDEIRDKLDALTSQIGIALDSNPLVKGYVEDRDARRALVEMKDALESADHDALQSAYAAARGE